ncbi:hypothetical protein CapIbe_011463 [Capra ibex]
MLTLSSVKRCSNSQGMLNETPGSCKRHLGVGYSSTAPRALESPRASMKGIVREATIPQLVTRYRIQVSALCRRSLLFTCLSQLVCPEERIH